MKTVNMLKYASVLVLAVLIGCKGKEVAEEAEKKEDQKVKVTVAQVADEPVEQIRNFTGTVEAGKKNNISPSIPLRINKILVEAGNRVSTGQLLVIMDSTQYVQTRIQLDNEELTLQRMTNLLKAGAIAQQEYDMTKAKVDVTRQQLSFLKQNMRLTSPMNGIVSERNYDNGDMFAQRPVLAIVDIQPVKTSVGIPETFFPKVKVGMKVKIFLDTYPDREFAGTVSLVYPTIDQMTRTFKVEISIPNNDSAIRPGMFARAQMNFGVVNHVVVPDLAIVKQEGSNERFVFTVDSEGVAHRKTVELGQRMNDKFEVISGLTTGDQVVTRGQSRLLEGSKVEVEK